MVNTFRATHNDLENPFNFHIRILSYLEIYVNYYIFLLLRNLCKFQIGNRRMTKESLGKHPNIQIDHSALDKANWLHFHY